MSSYINNSCCAAVQMFVEVVQHLPQPLHGLLVWLQEHGLEVHWQPISEGEQITVLQKAAREWAFAWLQETAEWSGDCTLKQIPQIPAGLWYGSRRWRLHWSLLWAIEQVDPAKISPMKLNYLKLTFKDFKKKKTELLHVPKGKTKCAPISCCAVLSSGHRRATNIPFCKLEHVPLLCNRFIPAGIYHFCF